MTYYYTYRLPTGKWRRTKQSPRKEWAEEDIRLHGQGRSGIIARNEKKLERKKRSADLKELSDTFEKFKLRRSCPLGTFTDWEDSNGFWHNAIKILEEKR